MKSASLLLHLLALDKSTLDAPSSGRRDFLTAGAAAAATAAAASCSSPLLSPAAASALTDGPNNAKNAICVTGANGYIGLHCVKDLLSSGYSVRAGVRSITEEKTKYLTQIAADLGASERLSFAAIDLFDVESMRKAGEGCDSMLHLASPLTFDTSGIDPVKNIVEPAIAGATNAVRAAEQVGLRRVVACGSVFGMVGSPAERGYDHIYGVEDVNGFNTVNGCTYGYSKMLSQQKSIALAAERGVDLITLNVGQVCGPALSPDQLNPSWEPFKLLAKPQPGGAVLGCVVPCFVDVRDVAAAHVAALKLPAADKPKRYVIAARKDSPTYQEIAELLADILPERNLPNKVDALPPTAQKLLIKGLSLGDKGLGELLGGLSVPPGKTLLCDNEAMLKDLLSQPRTVKTTLYDWVENQRQYGHSV